VKVASALIVKKSLVTIPPHVPTRAWSQVPPATEDETKKRSATQAQLEERQSTKKAKVESETAGDSTQLTFEGLFSGLLAAPHPTPEQVKAEWEKRAAELKKLKKQTEDLKLHESVLVMRLSTKEQEIHKLQTELQDLRAQFTKPHKELREVMLDQSLNSLFQGMKEQLKEVNKKLEQTKEDLSASMFTRESPAGRQLLAKLRYVQRENDELGQQLTEGNIHKLELEKQMQTELAEELKKAFLESNEYVIQLDEELNKVYGQSKDG